MKEVLVKGMMLPPNCRACPCSLIFRKRGSEEEDIQCFFQLEYGNTTMDRCPLVEVKPHGRCIDADFAIAQEKNYCKDCDNWNGIRCKTCEHDWIMMILDDAPTVLDATEGETDDKRREDSTDV